MHKIADKFLIILPLLLVGIHIFILIHYGYIRDEYINLSHDLDNIVWIGIFTLASFILMFHYYNFSTNYPITKTDYIDNEWLQGISLDEIIIDSEDITLVYIGTENQNEEFEEELIKQCEYYSYQMNTYYINDDDNYNDIFDYYDIIDTPILIITQNGQIIDKTSDINELSTIMRKYLYNDVIFITFTIYGYSEKPSDYIIDDNENIDFIIDKLNMITTNSNYLYDTIAGITYQLQLNGISKQIYKIEYDKLLYNDKVYQIEDYESFINDLN